MTQAGVILGTASYMSPEQARGKRVDKRADIWAFGCVLYEMLTGTRAFDGETLTDVLGAVVRAEPDWTRLPAGTPANVRRLLTRCLRKDTATRWRDIGDAAIELTEIEPDVAAKVLPTPSRMSALVAIFAAIAAIGMAAAGWTVGRFAAPAVAEDGPMRVSMTLPPRTSLIAAPQVSPDGNRIVVLLSDETGKAQLWQRSLAAGEFRPIADTQGTTSAFWSPDSRWLGVISRGHVRRMEIAGDRVETVCQFKGVFETGAWAADNTILLAAETGGLWRVHADGGEPAPATTLDEGAGERVHSNPAFLGDGRSFVFAAQSFGPLNAIRLASLDTMPASTVLLDKALIQGTAASGNQLLFKVGSALFSQSIELAAKRLTGVPQRVPQRMPYGFASAPSASSRVLAQADSHTADTELQWRDRKGQRLGVATAGGSLADPELSPNGDRMIYASHDLVRERGEIVLMDVSDGHASVVASSDGVLAHPIWSPDGREIAYMAFQKDGAGVYRLRLNSTSSPERVIGADTGVVAVSDWTNDGTRLIWKRFGGPTNDDVMVVSLSGAAGIAPVVSSAASENAGKLSPDGRWLAFSSDESGRDEVYIQPFPQGGRRWQVSRAGGTFPRWRADGRELFFYTRGDLSAAELTLSDNPRVGAVTTLFSFTRRPANVNDYPYAVTPDGQRFLVNVRSDQPPTVSILVNWQAALRQGAGGGPGR